MNISRESIHKTNKSNYSWVLSCVGLKSLKLLNYMGGPTKYNGGNTTWKERSKILIQALNGRSKISEMITE